MLPARKTMRLLCIGEPLEYEGLTISYARVEELSGYPDLEVFDYLIVSEGDGTLRRVIKALQHKKLKAKYILNPSGSFNVISKLHKTPKAMKILDDLASGKEVRTQTQTYHTLNTEVFLFSAGNMSDLQHIFIAETLRFGLLKDGMSKYMLSILFLLPFHLLVMPLMLLSSKHFFIFTPLSYLAKWGHSYGFMKEASMKLSSSYNHIELDGDIVTIQEQTLHLSLGGHIEIVTQ
jgi:hypothetical protein